MIAWLHIVPAFSVAAALAILPGLPIAAALRLRGLSLVAGSVAASFAVIALASFAAPVVGLGWGLVTIAIVTAAVTALALAVRLFDRRPVPAYEGAAKPRRLAYIAAFLIAAALISFVLVRAIGQPEIFSQSYDNAFHINAVAWILETGNASPLAMTMVTPEASQSFYPTLWHAVVSLVTSLSGASIPLATNAVSLVTAAGVWPIAILFFARPFFKSNVATILAAGILAAAFSAFPYHLFSWGILYPNLLSVALLPIALGFLHAALRHHALAETGRIAAVWVGFVGALGAAALAHPNAALGLVAISVPLFIVVARENFKRLGSCRAAWWRLAGIAFTLIAMGVMWSQIKTGDSSRAYNANFVVAALGAVTNSPITRATAWFVTVLMLVGIVMIWVRRKHRWLVVSYAITVMLYVIVASTTGPFRDLFTIGWYNDVNRLAFLLPITAMPLAVYGAGVMLDLARSGAADAQWVSPLKLSSPARQVAAATLVLLVILTGTRGPSMEAVRDDVSDMFTLTDGSGMVSSDEFALMSRLGDTTPDDALIAGNPWNGSWLAYAVGDRHVLFPHLKGLYTAEAMEFAATFRDLNPADACKLISDLGVTHVIGSDDPTYDRGGAQFKGLDDIKKTAPLTEIDREGAAHLYKVDC
ncbi:DUF6541 family protein [Leucobacter sp. HY1908]